MTNCVHYGDHTARRYLSEERSDSTGVYTRHLDRPMCFESDYSSIIYRVMTVICFTCLSSFQARFAYKVRNNQYSFSGEGFFPSLAMTPNPNSVLCYECSDS